MTPLQRSLCPHCGARLGRVPAAGFWERRVLRLIGLRPFRCRACRRRIVRRNVSLEAGESTPRPAIGASAPFVSPREADEFEELIRQIAAAERRAETGTKKAL